MQDQKNTVHVYQGWEGYRKAGGKNRIKKHIPLLCSKYITPMFQKVAKTLKEDGRVVLHSRGYKKEDKWLVSVSLKLQQDGGDHFNQTKLYCGQRKGLGKP